MTNGYFIIETTADVDAVWSRILNDQPISEAQFLSVAQWAYHAMPDGKRRGAAFDLISACWRRDGERPARQ